MQDDYLLVNAEKLFSSFFAFAWSSICPQELLSCKIDTAAARKTDLDNFGPKLSVIYKKCAWIFD
jgi:hypothetical protein